MVHAEAGFGVSPPVKTIEDLSPGEEAEFRLTINNPGDVTHTFTLSAFTPEEKRRRPGRAEFPDNSWVIFSTQQVEVEANSRSSVKVKVAIPEEEKWAGQDWEVWLEINPGQSGMLAVIMYVRLLVSTAEAEPAPVAMPAPVATPPMPEPSPAPTTEPSPQPESNPTSNWWMIAAKVGGALLVFGVYIAVRRIRRR